MENANNPDYTPKYLNDEVQGKTINEWLEVLHTSLSIRDEKAWTIIWLCHEFITDPSL